MMIERGRFLQVKKNQGYDIGTIREKATPPPPYVLARILDLLRHVVQIVPTVVRPQAGVESGRDRTQRRRSAAKCILQMLRVALAQLVRTATDHDQHRDQLRRRKHVLHGHAQVHAVAIHEQDAH